MDLTLTIRCFVCHNMIMIMIIMMPIVKEAILCISRVLYVPLWGLYIVREMMYISVTWDYYLLIYYSWVLYALDICILPFTKCGSHITVRPIHFEREYALNSMYEIIVVIIEMCLCAWACKGFFFFFFFFF